MSTNSEAKKAEIEKINKYTQDLYKENCNNANQLKKNLQVQPILLFNQIIKYNNLFATTN